MTKLNILCGALLAVAQISFVPPARAIVSSGGEYEIETSMMDASGGEKLTGGEYYVKAAIAQEALPDNIGLSTGGEYSNRKGFYNPPHFMFQRRLQAYAATYSGDIAVTLPAEATDKERFDITLNKNPVFQPLSIDPSVISEANSKIVNNEGLWAQVFPGNISEMAVFDEMGYYEKPFASKGVMTMRYADVNGDGILDGSNPPVRVDTLHAWGLDDTYDMWVKLPDVMPAAGSINVYFGMPGVYAVLGSLDNAVSNVYAFPVPFRPNGPMAGTGDGQTGTEASGITFTNVPQLGNVEIYTPDGRLVRKIAIPTGLPQPILNWDVKNSSGDKVASGVYIWRVVSGSNSKTGKLMVIW